LKAGNAGATLNKVLESMKPQVVDFTKFDRTREAIRIESYD
jgi:hypothetical protein